MSVAAVLLYTSPVFVTLMSALLFREAVTPFKLLGMAAILGAVLLLNLPPEGTRS